MWATDDSSCKRLSTSSFARQTLIGFGWACFPIMIVARRAYARAGFVAEGVARGSAFIGGKYRDELIMAILRTAWEQDREQSVSCMTAR